MGIYDDWKYRKNFYKYGTRIISDKVQSNVADDVSAKKNKNSIKYNYDEGIFVQGQKWFDDGYLLEDAPDELRNNASFIAGYEKGKRVDSINQQLYELGREYFDKGIELENVPDRYKNNQYFIDGFNSSSRKTR